MVYSCVGMNKGPYSINAESGVTISPVSLVTLFQRNFWVCFFDMLKCPITIKRKCKQ